MLLISQLIRLIRLYLLTNLHTYLNWTLHNGAFVFVPPCRFTCGLIYYALSLNTGELHGNIYLNTFISGAVEIPAYILCVFLMNWRLMGRRWSGIFALTGAGAFSFICIPLIIFSQSHAIITIIIIIIFVYLIADIPRNLALLTSTTQGGTHNSRHAGQRYIQKG